MSSAISTRVTPLATFRNETPYPFCPGCGHGPILDRLNEALVKLQLDPRRLVLVTDIGCSGLSDQYFDTSAFHGLHGRSLTYATGIKLARPDLEVVVILGDGGTGIGGAHLLNAARRNVGITALVFNNFNFGMTGGQHSVTTPEGAITSKTPGGNLERPLDLCATVGVNGAAWAGRFTSFDADLADRIAEAILTPGFALLDIWELCTAYYVASNPMSRKALSEMLDHLGFATGVLYRREAVEHAAAYRAAHAMDQEKPRWIPQGIEPVFSSGLDRRFHLVVAGSAGTKVRSAARLVAQAALLSGLYAAQRDDYPITVKTGHSVSELILSPEPIVDTGVEWTDALLVLSEDGRRKAGPYLAALAPGGRVFRLDGAGELSVAAETLEAIRNPLAALAAVLARLDLFPLAALESAARRSGKTHAEKDLEAIAAGAVAAERVP
jgi:pyruvate/2-oxoacid:ferredoxin oxidoreductase beta subunit/Pyruvate/2-oxoacid:ferredoxin oxidoreductase gamma subunit